MVLIGSPVGLEFTGHEGSVSNFSSRLGVALIQLDARINPGNGGGPVLDDQGRVVGVVSLKHMGAEGIGWAIPINYAWRKPGFLSSPGTEGPGFASLVAKAEEAGRRAAGEIASVPNGRSWRGCRSIATGTW